MIDLGRGLMLEDATQADLDYIHANLRVGDKAEHALDTEDFTKLENLPGVMVVKLEGDTLGYIGALCLIGESFMSKRRFVYYLSTTNVNKRKLTYVKRTREVLRALVNTLPEWVEELYTVSMPNAYPMACKWLEKVIGFRKLKDFEWRGEVNRLYLIERKEI